MVSIGILTIRRMKQPGDKNRDVIEVVDLDSGIVDKETDVCCYNYLKAQE